MAQIAQMAQRSVPSVVVLVLAAVLAIGGNQAVFAGEADPAVAALARLKSASAVPVRGSFAGGAARALIFSVPVSGQNAVERAGSFLRVYGDLLRTNSQHLELRLDRVEVGETDGVRFTQTYRGIPVFGAELKIELSRDRVLALGGALLRQRDHVDMRVRVDEAAAVLAARRAVDRDEAGLLADSRLVILDRGLFGVRRAPRPRLTWEVSLRSSPAERIFVDAFSGAILWRLPLDVESGFDLEVMDDIGPSTPPGVCLTPICGAAVVATETYFNPLYSSVPDGYRSYFYALELHAFWESRFGRDSYDDEGGQIEISIDYPDTLIATTQLWDDFIGIAPFQVDRDVLGHEFTHLVVRETSDLAQCYEAAALNEGYAHIMGNAFDQAVDDIFDWLLRDEPVTSMVPADSYPEWDMADPSKQGGSSCGPCKSIPDTWDAYLEPVDDPYQYAHENAGIWMKAHYLMSEGGVHPVTGVDVDKIGNTKMIDLAYKTLQGIPSNATFVDAATWTLHYATYWSTNKLHGFGPDTVCRVEQAFAATGIYVDSGSDCTGIASPKDQDGDGAPDATDNCLGVSNPSQLDTDDDDQGDVCDSNDDGDGYPDASDKCPEQATLYNGPCGDQDDDGVVDSEDNCRLGANPAQADSNGDGIGDACDSDQDWDGIWTMAGDNCPFDSNSGQENSDGDPWGDACDLCPLTTDPQPWMSSSITGNAVQPDGDGDGTPDACDDSVRVDGGSSKVQLQADGRSHTIDLRDAAANGFQRVPVQLCEGRCADDFEQRYRAVVTFGPIDPRLRAIIVDSEGKAVAKLRPNAPTGGSVASFSSRPGESYAIRFGFGQEVRRGESFNLRVSVALAAAPN